MGNGTRQWHLYVAAHPSAGYTRKQTRTQSTNAALTKRALQPHKWAMEQGNSTCVSPLALQQATRTNKRRHGSPLPTRHAFPSSMRCTEKAEGHRCECGPPRAPGNVRLALWRAQPMGTPPDVSQAIAATCWQKGFRMQIPLWHQARRPHQPQSPRYAGR